MTPWVRRLIFANVAVFFVQMTMPTLANGFAFVPMLALVRPWTIVTYMFLHGGLMHIGFNMLALYFFGPAVEARLGGKDFAKLYFVSGISGALLSMVYAPEKFRSKLLDAFISFVESKFQQCNLDVIPLKRSAKGRNR